MMRRLALVTGLAMALAACGVDGPPQRPAGDEGLQTGATLTISVPAEDDAPRARP